MDEPVRHRRGRRERGGGARLSHYLDLANPFAPQRALTDDAVAAIHGTALRVLEDLGVRVLLPEARAIWRAAGATVDEDSMMVRMGREMVEAALATAPGEITLHAREPHRSVTLAPGRLAFHAGAGCPQITDRDRGRRPGTLADFRDVQRLIDGFDVIHTLAAAVEPQDSAINRRHYDMTLAQLETSTKVPFSYARGRAQVEETFEMLALAQGLGADFADRPRTFTVINSNSPRTFDLPMAEGIIDFARHGQVTMITPFCLMGAMAPVTVAGALVLQHAEALAGSRCRNWSARGRRCCMVPLPRTWR